MRKKQFSQALLIGLICLIAINVAGWSIYIYLTTQITNRLAALGIEDPFMQTLIIVVSALAVVLVLGKWKLSKALKDVLD